VAYRLAGRRGPLPPDHEAFVAWFVGYWRGRRSSGGDRIPSQRHTSPSAAKAASKVLRDGRTSAASKKAAASALSQAAPKSSKKK
jgi:hypothetical protein